MPQHYFYLLFLKKQINSSLKLNYKFRHTNYLVDKKKLVKQIQICFSLNYFFYIKNQRKKYCYTQCKGLVKIILRV